LSGTEMLQALLTEFDVPFSPSAQRADLHNILNQFLLEQLTQGRVCIAIFDEAQHLSTEFLEQIRVLSNLETAEEKLIQIMLAAYVEQTRRIESHHVDQAIKSLSGDDADRTVIQGPFWRRWLRPALAVIVLCAIGAAAVVVSGAAPRLLHLAGGP